LEACHGGRDESFQTGSITSPTEARIIARFSWTTLTESSIGGTAVDGHLFRNRYSVFVIESDSQLEASCLYVLENPVRAGLCETASEWPWSGCPALAA
jgi:hypothetical protein